MKSTPAPLLDHALVAALCLAMGVLPSCGSEADPAGPAGAELQASRVRWSEGSIDDYRYVVQRLCECLPEVTRPVVVEVRDDRVVARTYLGTAEPVPAELVRFYPSVEGLFGLAAEALQSGADLVEIEYDAVLGHPVRLLVDEDRELADEELLLLISAFERL